MIIIRDQVKKKYIKFYFWDAVFCIWKTVWMAKNDVSRNERRMCDEHKQINKIINWCKVMKKDATEMQKNIEKKAFVLHLIE